MEHPLRMFGEELRRGAGARVTYVRLGDGSAFRVPLERYLGPADAIDEGLLDGLEGPVLDVGCGPGRHLHALSARGVFALGVDLSPVAVELAIGGGARAIVGDVFDELPGAGTWRTALLLDGNIGIGGSPVRLLTRLAALLDAPSTVLVEVEPPGAPTCSTRVRIERDDGAVSAWFPWARVGASEIARIARVAGFRLAELSSVSERWFAHLRRLAP
jgi:SAM-dependent methyltransferase